MPKTPEERIECIAAKLPDAVTEEERLEAAKDVNALARLIIKMARQHYESDNLYKSIDYRSGE